MNFLRYGRKNHLMYKYQINNTGFSNTQVFVDDKFVPWLQEFKCNLSNGYNSLEFVFPNIFLFLTPGYAGGFNFLEIKDIIENISNSPGTITKISFIGLYEFDQIQNNIMKMNDHCIQLFKTIVRINFPTYIDKFETLLLLK